MQNIKQLDMLRGLAALMVVLFHMKPFWEYVFPGKSALLDGGSYLGVSVFFIISGFVMGVATRANEGIASFALKRVFRVYVPAVVATLLYLAIQGSPIDLFNVLKLVPAGGAAPYYGYGLYFITWTLVYEIVFYLLFAIAMSVSWRYRVEITALLILVNVFVLQRILTGDISLNANDVPIVGNSRAVALVSFLVNPINLLFVVGLAWYRFYVPVRGFIRRLERSSLALYLVLLTSAVTVGFFLAKGHGVLQMGLFAIILFSVFMAVHCLQDDAGEMGLAERGLIWLGKISYSLYLCHYLAIDLRIHYFPYVPKDDLRWQTLAVGIAIALGGGAFYYLIDLPTHRAGAYIAKRFLKRPVSTRAAQAVS